MDEAGFTKALIEQMIYYGRADVQLLRRKIIYELDFDIKPKITPPEEQFK